MILRDRPFPEGRHPERCCDIMTVQQDRWYSDQQLAFPHTLRVLRSLGSLRTTARILATARITTSRRPSPNARHLERYVCYGTSASGKDPPSDHRVCVSGDQSSALRETYTRPAQSIRSRCFA